MGLVSLTEFEHLLAKLNSDDFSQFIADLWTARGIDTTIAGERIVCSSNRSNHPLQLRVCTQRVLILGRFQFSLPGDVTIPVENITDSDILVTNVDSERLRTIAEATDTKYIGPSQLRSLLLYAIDRDAGDRLCHRYFDRPISCESQSSTGLGPACVSKIGDNMSAQIWGGMVNDQQDTSTRADVSGDVPVPIIGLELVFATLLIGSLAVGVSSIGLPTTIRGAEGPVGGPGHVDETYPTGVNTSGLTEPVALIRAHEKALEERTYHLSIRHRDTRGSLVTARQWRESRQQIWKSAPGRYRVRVNGSLAPVTVGASPRPVQSTLRVWPSGCTGLTTKGKEVLSESTPCTLVASDDLSSFGNITSQYLDRYLDEDQSTVTIRRRGDRVVYRIVVTEAPDALSESVTNYTAVAIVDKAGYVSEFSVTYQTQLVARNGPVSFSFRFEEVESINDQTNRTSRIAG